VSLLEDVRSAETLPVFVIGGPCRCGCAASRWGDAEWLSHHAQSWRSAWILTGIDETAVCAALTGEVPEGVYARDWFREHPVDTLAAARRLALPDPRQAPTLAPALECIASLAGGPRPVLVSVWGPLTAAATLAGPERFLRLAVMEPEVVLALVERTTAAIRAFASAALAEGGDYLWVAEPLAALFSPAMYDRYGDAPLRALVQTARLADAETILHVCGDTAHLTSRLAAVGVAGLSIDAVVDLVETSRIAGPGVVIIGNLWPVDLLEATAEELAISARAMATAMRGHPYVAATGCSCPEGVTPSSLAAFVDAAASEPGLAVCSEGGAA